MTSSSPATPARPPRLSPLIKGFLVVEVLLCYARVRRAVDRESIVETLARLRDRKKPSRRLPLPAQPRRLSAIVQLVLRRLPSDTRCLMQSLTLLAMLERRRTATTLVIGITEASTFGAHAWIELAGDPLLRPEQPGRRLAEL